MTASLTPTAFLAATAVFLLAGCVKGVVGLGLPTVAMALLALVMPPAQAAALLVVPSLVTNLLQLRPLSGLGPMVRRLGGMQLGVCAGTLAGAAWIGAPAGQGAAVALGTVLILYAAWGLRGAPLQVPARAERWLGPAVGVATGLVTAATGVFVVPAVPYLQSLGLARDELVQAMGLSFTVSTLVLSAGLAANGAYPGTAALSSVALLVPAVIGMAAGQWLRGRLSPAWFKACFFIGLGLLGLYMAVRGLVSLQA
ncbi:sulfite exporter TauE/SafE family protein [Acidovorax sp. SUPP1855]|uniref:sulfite exporter TauE/SafE family protein n=1 Tax=Acidovorax sp. SUPP1855 TaxID=431774 RepID=UPI0023DE57F3|nr:sulfite exporter TauE/SafE family protein [Acidovorax sp. SUPP1855]GKS83485.1 sulfite exporter TauE/SafE family protein [Acidovorax sp. SUPP1855]